MTEELTGDDAREVLAALDNLLTSIDENVSGDFSPDIDQSLWDDYGKALDVLRDYGIREPAKPLYRRV
jgi:hypothetical protein